MMFNILLGPVAVVMAKLVLVKARDVEAVIFLPLPQTKNEQTTADLSSTKFVIYYNQKV